MTNCWSEGALRAYLDRELLAEDMKAVAAHLGECSSCDALCAELTRRAARVFELLEALPEPERVVPLRKAAPERPAARWLWPGAAAALAAGLAIASWVVSKKPETLPPPVARVTTPESIPDTVKVPMENPDPVAIEMPARAPAVQTVRTKRPPSVLRDYFLALDDEPIESGVIMRVAIQPGNVQADIVVDPDGRARAIRLGHE